ncbi:MAG: class I SAM-dependent methyltransferase [Candidatus Paceibacterota bacterium]|jgi:hypothetical protein|nr:class I SAM-dependent methyltransferase [Candidatus Paceibacterota bacterium]
MKETTQSRKDLAKLFTGIGAEIGVERAMFSKHIAQTSDLLYCVDAWDLTPGYRDHVSKERLDDFFKETKERMKNFNCKFVRKLSMDAVKDFKDGSLDFVYIDANHSYESAKEDIREWSKKVKKGGIVSGHDYIDKEGYGVMQAVNELNEEITIWKGDNTPSWSYVKF